MGVERSLSWLEIEVAGKSFGELKRGAKLRPFRTSFSWH